MVAVWWFLPTWRLRHRRLILFRLICSLRFVLNEVLCLFFLVDLFIFSVDLHAYCILLLFLWLFCFVGFVVWSRAVWPAASVRYIPVHVW